MHQCVFLFFACLLGHLQANVHKKAEQGTNMEAVPGPDARHQSLSSGGINGTVIMQDVLREIKAANEDTTTAAAAAQTTPMVSPEPFDNRPVKMGDLVRALADLEHRLATGNRLVYMDDVKRVFEEIEKRHNKTAHEIENCDEAQILRESLKPAVKEDLWELLGMIKGGPSKRSHEMPKPNLRDGQFQSPPQDSTPGPLFLLTPYIGREQPFFQPLHIHHMHQDQVHYHDHEAHQSPNYEDQQQEVKPSVRPSLRRNNNHIRKREQSLVSPSESVDGIYKGVADLVQMLRLGVNIEQIKASSSENINWVKIKVPNR